MRRIYLIIIILFISLSGFSQNEKKKGIFIYSFTKYIRWPAGLSQGDFIIGVFGSPAMSAELDIIAKLE